MEVKFWKKGLAPIVFCLSSAAVCLVMVVLSACGVFEQGVFEQIDTWSLIALWLIFMLLCLLPLCMKYTFAKVALSNSGITLTEGKKQIAFIDWFDIDDVKANPNGRTPGYFKFTAKDVTIEVVPNQKLFDTIMEICPNMAVKIYIKDHPYLYMMRKRWLKKQEKINEKSDLK